MAGRTAIRTSMALGAIFVLAGCDMPSLQVRPAFLKLPQGDDSYSVGFRDGCDSSLGIVGGGTVASTNDFSMDANRGIEDRDYYEGYQMGANYCTYYLDPGPI